MALASAPAHRNRSICYNRQSVSLPPSLCVRCPSAAAAAGTRNKIQHPRHNMLHPIWHNEDHPLHQHADEHMLRVATSVMLGMALVLQRRLLKPSFTQEACRTTMAAMQASTTGKVLHGSRKTSGSRTARWQRALASVTDSGARGQNGLDFSADRVADPSPATDHRAQRVHALHVSNHSKLATAPNQILHLTYVVHQLLRPTARTVPMSAAP